MGSHTHYPLAWASRGKESRISHLVWMIQNHPEWDGFTANPRRALTNPRSEEERGSYHRLKEAWLQQVEPLHWSGIVLHNAAMFFARREHELAVELLRRAIALNPSELVYVERLGMLYAFCLFPPTCVEPGEIPANPTFRALAQLAEDTLSRSDDWVFLAGALTATTGGCSPTEPDLYTRLRQLRPGEAPWSIVDNLPSRTSSWCRSTCIPAEFDGN